MDHYAYSSNAHIYISVSLSFFFPSQMFLWTFAGAVGQVGFDLKERPFIFHFWQSGYRSYADTKSKVTLSLIKCFLVCGILFFYDKHCSQVKYAAGIYFFFNCTVILILKSKNGPYQFLIALGSFLFTIPVSDFTCFCILWISG